MTQKFVKDGENIVRIEENKSLTKFEKWHTYVKKGTEKGMLIKYLDEEDTIEILNQFEHWDKCSMCKIKRSEK